MPSRGVTMVILETKAELNDISAAFMMTFCMIYCGVLHGVVENPFLHGEEHMGWLAEGQGHY